MQINSLNLSSIFLLICLLYLMKTKQVLILGWEPEKKMLKFYKNVSEWWDNVID